MDPQALKPRWRSTVVSPERYKVMTRTLTLRILLLSVLLAPTFGISGAIADTAGKLDTYLERLVPFGFWGTVLIARDGEVALFAPSGLSKRTLARRYALGVDNGTVLESAYPDWNRMGAGDVLSTTGDLYRWHKALLGSEILSEMSKQRMYTPVANGYGYGWFISDGDHGRLIEHDGGSSKGSAADFRRYTEGDLVIIVLTNNDGEYMLFSARLRDNIRDLTFGATLPLAPKVPKTSDVPATDFVGAYQFDDNATLEVMGVGSLVEITGVGQSAVTALLSMSQKEAEEHTAVSQRTSRVLQGIRNQDLEPLREASAGRMGDRLESMFAKMAKSLGEVTGYSVLGTVPPAGVDAADFMTLFRIDFGETSQLFRFYWSDDGIIALGGAGMREPVRIRATAVRDAQFVGYHLATGRSVNFQFHRDGSGRVSGVTAGRQQLRAVRQKTQDTSSELSD